MKNVWTDFKKFVNKGNIIDLAVGIIIGSTFSSMLNSLVYDIFMPFISRALDYDITSAKWILREKVVDANDVVLVTEIAVKYGQFLQYVINFLVIAISLFVAMRVFNHLAKKNLQRKIKYIKNLKARRPDLFDEEDEPGTLLYEKMKKEHPEYFQDEIAQKIEEADQIKKEDPTVAQLELLSQINEKLSQLVAKKEVEENE